MSIYSDCNCSEYGQWASGIKLRVSGGYGCANCNGEVNRNLVLADKIIEHPTKEFFCNCGIPLGLDYKFICRRCSLPVSTSRTKQISELESSINSKQGISQKKGIGVVGWTILIFFIGALIGGITTMNDKPTPQNGFVEEGNYEQSDGLDFFVGTP